MKRLAAVLPLLAVLPLAAQTWEVTLFEGRQTYRNAGAQDGTLGVTENLSTARRNVTAVRAGWTALDLDVATLQVTGAYQPMTTSTQTSYLLQGYPTAPYASYDYKAGYSALGAMARFTFILDMAVGLDFRFEQLSAQGFSTTYDRPWARAQVGYAFALPAVRPILGAEAAYPLSSKNLQLLGATDNSLQATAPKGQLGVYAGIRF